MGAARGFTTRAAMLAGLCAPLLLAGSGAAAAASFDCARAGNAFERAICADADLSRRDEVLAKAYATAIGGLESEALQRMRAGQREWLDYAQRACTPEAVPLEDDYDEDGIACLSTTFTTRIGELEHSRMLGGQRFYVSTRHQAVFERPEGTDETDWWVKVTDKSLVTPRIDGDDALAKAFNAHMQTLEDESSRPFDPDAPEPEGELDEGYAGTDLTLTVAVETVTDTRISSEVSYWFYGHGAAHGNYAITLDHFLVEPLRPLRAEDIFAGSDWQPALKNLVVEELTARVEDGLFAPDADYVGDIVADPQRWDFSETGLIVRFQPYEVGPYAMGAPTVEIALDKLRAYLAEDALDIAGWW